MKLRVNLNVGDDVHEILTEVSARAGKPLVGHRKLRGSASQYVESLVRDAATEWRLALEHLLHEGWTRPELVVACRALAGLTDGYRPADEIADVVLAAAKDDEELVTIAQTLRDGTHAGAMYTLAREWARNPIVQREIEDRLP